MHPLLSGVFSRNNFLGNQTLSTNPTRFAFVFPAPKAGQLEEVAIQLAAISNNQTLKISFQDRAASQPYPDDVVDQFKTHTPVVNSVNVIGPITSDGTSGGTRRTVAMHEMVCLVIEFNATAGSVSIRTQTGTDAQLRGARCFSRNTTTWGTTDQISNGALPVFAVRYVGDTDFTPLLGVHAPSSDVASVTASSSTTPDEIGMSFIAPYDGARLAGVYGIIGVSQTNNSAIDMILYDALDAVVQTVQFTIQQASAFGSPVATMFDFDRASLVALTGGERYRVVFRPTATGTIELNHHVYPSSVVMAATPEGSTAYWTQRTNGGAWTDTILRMPFMSLYWSDDPTFVPSPIPPSPLPVAIVEACFGVAPSGKLGYRNYVKEHPDIIAHWYLSDIGPIGAEDSIVPNDAGLYFGGPGKSKGLLPEYGLSANFDGIDDYVEVDYDDFGLGSNAPFSWSFLCRPAAVTSAAARCIHMSGTDGGYVGLDTTGHFTFGKNGGSKASLADPIEEGAEYLVICRYDGTTATIEAWNTLALRTSDAVERGRSIGAASAAVSIGPHGASDAFIGKGGSLEYAGDIQALAVFGDDLSDAECLEILACCVWVDISGDARATVPIEIQRGMMSDQPDARVAPVGVCTFGLNNAFDNTGNTQSWYSPGHANCREGFARGTPLRVILGTEILGSAQQFIGTIQSIRPMSGVHRDKITYIEARDWMEEAARFNLKGIETQQNVVADDILTLILMRMQNKPHNIDFAAGSDVYPTALDNTKDERAFAQSEFSRLMMSEMGLLYLTGDGTLVFENRSSRSLITTVSYEFDNDMSESEPDASVDQVINRVRVTVHPREIDAAATTSLFETSGRMAIDHGITTETFLQFRDPNQRSARFGGLDVVTPVANTHYTLNTAEDGSGADVTLSPLIAITWEISGSGIYMSADNQFGQRVYMQLEVLGKGVYDFEPVTVIEENEESIDSIGVNEVNIDMPYQVLVPVAQSAALQILNTYGEGPTRLKSLSYPVRKAEKYLLAGINGEISQRLLALEEMSGVDGEFFINGIKIQWNADQDIKAWWSLTPADNAEYWVMDQSELDITTKLGF